MEAEAATVRAPALGRGWPSLRNSQRPFGVGGVRDGSGGVCSHQRWGQGHSWLPVGSLVCWQDVEGCQVDRAVREGASGEVTYLMEVRQGAVNSLQEGRPWQSARPVQRPGGSAQLVCLGRGAAP